MAQWTRYATTLTFETKPVPEYQVHASCGSPYTPAPTTRVLDFVFVMTMVGGNEHALSPPLRECSSVPSA